MDNLLRAALEDDFAAGGAAVGAEVDNPVGLGECGHSDVGTEFKFLCFVFLCACRDDCQHTGQHYDYFFHLVVEY